MGTEGGASSDELTSGGGERLLRSTAVMSAGTAISRITGFLRIAAAAFAFGVAETRLADAYNVANNVPNILYELVLGGILSSVFVPVFVEQLSREEEDPWHVARAVMTLGLVVLGVVMLIGIIAAPWIVRLYTLRWVGTGIEASRDLATLFLRFFMPQIVLYGLGTVATGVLNAHRRFAAPMFAPILNNLVVIASFLLFAFLPGPAVPSPGNLGSGLQLVLAVGTTLGVAVMTFTLWPSLRRLGFRWRWTLDLRHPAVRKLARLSGWAVIYVVVNQLGLLVVLILAGPVRGGVTAYQYAFIFFQLPHAIFSVSIMTALLPRMSEAWVRRDVESFRSSLARGIRTSALVVVPAAAGYLVLSKPIVRLLLEHGVATDVSTQLVGGVLTFFAIGLFPFSAFQLLLRAFYALQDTRTPALINVMAVALNVGLNLVLFPVLQVRGLALGHAASYAFAAVVAALVLRRRLGGLEGRALARGLGGIAIGAALTAAAAWGAARGAAAAFGNETLFGQMLEVGAGVVAGLVVFVASALFFRLEEFELVRRVLRRRR